MPQSKTAKNRAKRQRRKAAQRQNASHAGAVVVREHVPAPGASARKRNKGGGIGAQRASSDAQILKLALVNPFNPRAIGVRVPDALNVATATYHVRSSINVSTNASGSVAMLCLPSPCMSYVFGTNLGAQSGGAGFSQNTTSGYFVSPSNLAAYLTEYRTVSWGIRIVPKNTAFATKGKIVMITVPTTANAPSWNTMETVSASSPAIVSEYICGLDINSAAAWVNHPSAQVMSMPELLSREVMVAGRPFTPSFYEFKGTTDRSVFPWTLTYNLADEVVTTGTALVNSTAAGRKDVASLRGGMAVGIFATGLNAISNEFDIEYVYHLEGTPNMGTATAQLVPSAMRLVEGSTNVVESVLSAVGKVCGMIQFVENPVASGVAMGRSLLRDLSSNRQLLLR